jgi:hypothetical protein
MTVAELLRAAAACRTCGFPHAYRWAGHGERTWQSLTDGHAYAPLVDVNIVVLLHFTATGRREHPWGPLPCQWWTEEIVKQA